MFTKFPKRNNLPNSIYHCSSQSASHTTVDPEEVRRFQALASKWWDEQGEFAALHSMNDLRIPFIRWVLIRALINAFLIEGSLLKPLTKRCEKGHCSEKVLSKQAP